MRSIRFVMLAVLALVFAVTACKKEQAQPGKTDEVAKPIEAVAAVDKKVKMDLFVMSKCPYGVQALDAVIPAVEKLGPAVELNIEYIGRLGPDGVPTSMHGEPEVTGNVIQLCAADVAPDKHLAFLKCQNENWRKIPEGWEECATKTGIDVAKVTACKDGEKGMNLFKESIARAESAGAKGSPTIKVDGEAYAGGRKENDILRSLCAKFGEGAPAACASIPAPVVVEVFALTDSRCKECALDPAIGRLSQLFPGLKAKTLDFSDPEGKKLYEEAGLTALPALLFNDSIEKDADGMKQIAQFLVPAGSYKSLRIKAEFDPKAEICDNEKDDTANGKVDCADETCKESLVCREDKPGKLDVFVMSQCPYGVLGLNAMKEVIDAFGDEIDFDVHFIGDEKDGEIVAMHGPAEVAENIRELCAVKHFPKNNKYMDYIWCRNQDIRSDDWKKCTGKNGIKEKVIDKCQKGEGKKLLSEDMKLAKDLKIGGSPTWLLNNKIKFSGVAAGAIQTNICKANPDFKGCAKPLAATPAQQAPQGSCGG